MAYVVCPACGARQSPAARTCRRCTRYFTSKLDPDKYRAEDGGEGPRRREFQETHRWLSWTTVIAAGVFVFFGLVVGSRLWAVPDAALWATGLTILGSLSLFYVGLALVVNRTKISASHDGIRVARGPLWFPLADSFSLGPEDIERIDVYKVVTITEKSRKTTSYELKLFTRKGDLLDVLELDKEREALAMYFDLEDILKLEPPPVPEPVPEPQTDWDREDAEVISRIYRKAIPGTFLVSAACMIYLIRCEGEDVWRFDLGFALVFVAFVVALFCVFYYHHRKYLSWIDSKPRGEGEQPGPRGAYVVLTLIMAGLCLPIPMLVYYFLIRLVR